MDPRDRKALIATGSVIAALFAIGAIGSYVDSQQPRPLVTTSTDPAFEARYKKAEADKRAQERALYCAGRPENC
ncbi:MAG TPA: hypothetical protein VF027_03730 [Sphingomicrobium sp.]